jgi:hypothetical protein
MGAKPSRILSEKMKMIIRPLGQSKWKCGSAALLPQFLEESIELTLSKIYLKGKTE